MERITWLLDAGHGGMIPDGEGGLKYATAPAKMYTHPEGLTIYEGVFNRQVIQLVKDIMKSREMLYKDVVNSEFDITLSERVDNANDFYAGNKRCGYFSMHGNASGVNARGIEIFTSMGETMSDNYSSIIMSHIKGMFPDEKYRFDYSDGDVDKESNFYVLRKTNMPAVLLEMWFFDNYNDALKMNNPEMRLKVATAIVDAFEEIESVF